MGIDPDLGGAIGVVDVNCNADGKLFTGLQIMDMPCSKVLINRKNRRYEFHLVLIEAFLPLGEWTLIRYWKLWKG